MSAMFRSHRRSRSPTAASRPFPTLARLDIRSSGAGSVVTAVLIAYAMLASQPTAAAAAKSCLRDGAKLVVADRSVRVVRIRERPSRGATRVDRMLGCWVPTGKRFTLFRERDLGDDERQSTEWEIVDGRFVGAKRMFSTGVSDGASAESFDVRAGKRLADSSRCDRFEGAPEGGVQDVAFLPRGGMAYACGQLWLQSPAKGAVQLEPPGTNVTHLAVSNNTDGSLLYWTVVSGGRATAKALSYLP